MKIELHNVGPIEYFEFDTEKDLNLIYGKNSVGKSYAIYCVYNLLKNLHEPLQDVQIPRYYFQRYPDIGCVDLSIVNTIKEKACNAKDKIDITKDILAIIRCFFEKSLLSNIQKSFTNTFSSLQNLNNRLSQKEFLIRITIGFTSIDIVMDNNDTNTVRIQTININHIFEIIHKQKKTDRYLIYIDNLLFHTIISKGNHPVKGIFVSDFAFLINDYISHNLFNKEQGIEKIYFLPSSRSGLYQALNSFSPIIAELSKSRFYIDSKIELPSLSEPIADYFIKISTLDNQKKNIILENVAKAIEEIILKGKVSYDDKLKRINFIPHNTDLLLDLSESSSMVAEIAPIVTYFRHIIGLEKPTTKSPYWFYDRENKVDDTKILFIEEPEAHLHPEVQIQLMEIFVELTKLNVKVVITSHSNYMFQQLDNMILEGKIAPEKVASYHLVMGKNGSKDAGDMKATSEGMEDNNFVEISEKLYEKKMEIFDKLNADIINAH